jgi:hypothetical protein
LIFVNFITSPFEKQGFREVANLLPHENLYQVLTIGEVQG